MGVKGETLSIEPRLYGLQTEVQRNLLLQSRIEFL
jgi:hypothetical protein